MNQRITLLVQVHLEEFNALRRQINMVLSQLVRIAQLYVIIVGVVIGVIFSEFGNPLLAAIITFVTPIFAVFWIRTIADIRKLGVYIGTHLRDQLIQLLDSSAVLNWEPLIAREYKNRLNVILERLTPILMFFFPSIGAAIGPAMYLQVTQSMDSEFSDLKAPAWLLFGGGVGVNLIWLLLYFLSKDPYDVYNFEKIDLPASKIFNLD